ncbi:MAG: hypothetical protein A3E82_05315 [Gammaproteobacteria bacterium RIFCSPHIGHO2_12_FULL_38_11]|nr:MAG: hypothetical protein A3E82_05315 [Gammaproteobacteria bacterium RIFCSPHIGHO2_12_FULL_38_11]
MKRIRSFSFFANSVRFASVSDKWPHLLHNDLFMYVASLRNRTQELIDRNNNFKTHHERIEFLQHITDLKFPINQVEFIFNNLLLLVLMEQRVVCPEAVLKMTDSEKKQFIALANSDDDLEDFLEGKKHFLVPPKISDSHKYKPF